ncbi:MAG: rRNA pseudouridine synthase [Caldiserica bacterium]|nr:rRNA pseudouridine synthase [Caldisericota bacterium]
MRLNKYLRAAGVASRRGADELIRAGRVRVNGDVVTEPWHEVDPGRDVVEVDSRRVYLRRERHYFKLYKPRGVVSTLRDPHAERTLARFIPAGLRLVPAGRLDRDSEGLVILTDDGDLIYRLTHPSFEVPKRYRVTLDRYVGEGDLERLSRGIELEDGPFLPDAVRRVGPREVELVIHEGRKREIRRAFRALGYGVVRLVRTAMGPVELGDMRPGELRPLSPAELRALGIGAKEDR